MLSEGTIIQNLMLTRLLSKTPLACLFQSIDIDTGERYLVKVARSEWLDLPGTIQSLGFDFRPGQALSWRPVPEEIIQSETELLKELDADELAVPKPLFFDRVNDTVFAIYRFFDGITLDEAFESGSSFTIPILINLLEEVDKLKASGLFHGNLQPSSILIGAGQVLLTDLSYPATVISGRTRKRLLRCITVPEFYPFLDPRHDELAMGILLYTLVTGKHPLALETIARRLDYQRKTGPKFSAVIDEARERGANRFLSPLLSFVNPVDVKGPASKDFEELVLKTLGFARVSVDGQEIVEVVPDSWLDNLAGGNKMERKKTWTLASSARALGQIFNIADSSQSGSGRGPEKRAQKGVSDAAAINAEGGAQVSDSSGSLSFAPEDLPAGVQAGGSPSDVKRLEPSEIIFEDTILPACEPEPADESSLASESTAEEDLNAYPVEQNDALIEPVVSQTNPEAAAPEDLSLASEDKSKRKPVDSGGEASSLSEKQVLQAGKSRVETAAPTDADEDGELAAVSELLADSITGASEPAASDLKDKPAQEK